MCVIAEDAGGRRWRSYGSPSDKSSNKNVIEINIKIIFKKEKEKRRGFVCLG